MSSTSVGIEIAGVRRRTGNAIVDAARLDHAAGDVAGDHARVVAPLMVIDDRLQGAVDGGDDERVRAAYRRH